MAAAASPAGTEGLLFENNFTPLPLLSTLILDDLLSMLILDDLPEDARTTDGVDRPLSSLLKDDCREEEGDGCDSIC